MSPNTDLKVIFIDVADNATKLQRLCAIVEKHFSKKEHVLILAPSDDAANYIDQLLWRMPEESFIPHVIAKSPTKELIAISTQKSNHNQAQIIINLCTEIPPHEASVHLIYELLDRTHPAKEELARQRLAAYQTAGAKIEEL